MAIFSAFLLLFRSLFVSRLSLATEILVSMAKTPSALILLAFSTRDRNPIHSFNFSDFSPFIGAHVSSLSDFSISPFPARSQVRAGDGNPRPSATAQRSQPRSQATKTSSARSTLLGITLQTL